MIRSWVTLVGALVALVVILATHFLGEAAGDFLAPLIFWLPVVALLLVIAAAVTSLAQDSSTAAGAGPPRPPEITSSAESSPPVTRVDRSGEGRWTELAEGCVDVIDELDQHIVGFDEPRQELAEHVMLRLEEVLERSGVEVIVDDASFDRARHRPLSGGVEVSNGAAITETISPGFAVGQRVLRRARVQVE
jgi:hypothetical protein